MTSIFLLFLGIGVLLIYFVPTLVANESKSKRVSAIFILNLLTGWTLIGWIAALIWAMASDKADETIAASVRATPSMYCISCGSKLHPGAQFCASCGARITHSGQQAISTQVPTIALAQREHATTALNEYTDEIEYINPNASLSWPVIIVGCAIAFLLIALFGYYGSTHPSTPDSSTPTSYVSNTALSA
jgi:hypothetical protein